jgi:hypothetical protein
LRASITATSASDRKSVVRRLPFTDSMMKVMWPTLPFRHRRLSQAAQRAERWPGRFGAFAARAGTRRLDDLSEKSIRSTRRY